MASGRQETRRCGNKYDTDSRRVSTDSIENIPLAGADVPFEELLARELNKLEGDGSVLEIKSSAKASKKPYLKKLSRGWWMRRPGAKQKVVKHTLVSKGEVEDAGNSGINSTRKKSAKHLSRSQRHPSVSSSETLSPVLTPPKQIRTAPTPSPTVSPIRRTRYSYQINGDEDKVLQSRQEVAAWKTGSLRSTTSTDTMSWKILRHSFEANREREADEMAEFEAIEQDLAAEKEAYFEEKQQLLSARADLLDEGPLHDNQVDDLMLSSSSFVSEINDQELSRWQNDGQEIVDDNFNEGPDSALVLDDYSNLSKYDYVTEANGMTDQLRYRLEYNNNVGDISSDLSAVSFDDSVPWDDGLSFQPRQSSAHGECSNAGADNDLLESQLKQRASVDDTQKIDNGLRTTIRKVSFADSGDKNMDTLECSKAGITRIPDTDPPVSSLVQQIFGGHLQDENDDNSVNSVDDNMIFNNARGNRIQINGASTDLSKPPLPSIQDKSLSVLKQKLHGKQSLSTSKELVGKTRAIGATKVKPTGRTSMKQKSGVGTGKAPHLRSRASPVGTGLVLPAVIEEKLLELEEEVKFYKSETLHLKKRKDFYDQEVKRLSLERDKFVQYQQEQRLLIEKEREQERVRMKKEEKNQERQWKLRMNATISHQDRKDRGEVEMLKAQIVKMKLDENARVSKLKAGNDNLRQRITELEDRNRELAEDIKFLEKDRLEQWEKYECLVKEREDACESNLKCKTTISRSSDLGEFRTIEDVALIKETADDLLQRWNFSRGDGSHRDHKETVLTTTAGPDHKNVRCNGTDVYNPKRYSIDRRDSYRSDEPKLYTDESGFESTNGESGFESTNGESGFESTNGDSVINPVSLKSSTATPLESAKRVAADDKALQSNNFLSSGGITAAVPTSILSKHSMTSKEIIYPGGKKELLFFDGSKKITFPDGNEKEIDANGHVVIKFTNGDQKEIFPDMGISVYYYFEAQTKLTTYPDNRKVYEFPNEQVETSLPDGTTEIQFADGIKKTISPDGTEFSVFPDGTTMLEFPDGLREVTLLSKQKIRYFPDGQMVCVAPDGLETRVQSDSELNQLMTST